jgi:hypothetical protein
VWVLCGCKERELNGGFVWVLCGCEYRTVCVCCFKVNLLFSCRIIRLFVIYDPYHNIKNHVSKYAFLIFTLRWIYLVCSSRNLLMDIIC